LVIINRQYFSVFSTRGKSEGNMQEEKFVENLKRPTDEAVQFIRTQTDHHPKIGIILGSGLGGLTENIKDCIEIPYKQIPHFPASTVKGHAGRLLLGKMGGNDVVVMDGRFHYYEGYSLQQVTFPVRVMKKLGINIMIVTNAAGGLNPQFCKGDIVLITDHINFLGDNPLIGKNDDKLGPRFPDMFNCYDEDLRSLAIKTTIDEKIPLRRGVYVAVSGPTLETPAEYTCFRIIGGDLVGMSSVPETIAARHQGIKVIGFSIVTNVGLSAETEPTTHEAVMAAAEKAGTNLSRLIEQMLEQL